MSAVLAQVAPAPNRPPRWTQASDSSHPVGEHLEQSYRAEDPERDPLTYTIEGLPMGAKAEEREGSIALEWTPGDGDVGTYPITLRATDARGGTAVRVVKLTIEESVDHAVMPGVEYALYAPADALPAKLGVFMGPSVRFCAYCYVHRTEKRGPSHGQIYLDFDLLAPLRDGSSALFVASVGFDLSFERFPARRFLIPYFGCETGLFYQKQTETLGMVLPFAGVHLWAGSNLAVGLRAGALVPFSSGRFEQVLGLRAGLGATVAFW